MSGNAYIASYAPDGSIRAAFKILSYNKETKRGRIVGAMQVSYESNLSKEYITKNGYKLVRELPSAWEAKLNRPILGHEDKVRG